MREGLLSHRRNHNARSLVKRADGTETIWGLNHLDNFFQDKFANEISTRSLQAFVECRKREGANVATINRNLGLLRRMFRLAAPDNPLLKIANFAAVHFKEDHVRQGFLDAANFDKLLAALPARRVAHPLQIFLLDGVSRCDGTTSEHLRRVTCLVFPGGRPFRF